MIVASGVEAQIRGCDCCGVEDDCPVEVELTHEVRGMDRYAFNFPDKALSPAACNGHELAGASDQTGFFARGTALQVMHVDQFVEGLGSLSGARIWFTHWEVNYSVYVEHVDGTSEWKYVTVRSTDLPSYTIPEGGGDHVTFKAVYHDPLDCNCQSPNFWRIRFSPVQYDASVLNVTPQGTGIELGRAIVVSPEGCVDFDPAVHPGGPPLKCYKRPEFGGPETLHWNLVNHPWVTEFYCAYCGEGNVCTFTSKSCCVGYYPGSMQSPSHCWLNKTSGIVGIFSHPLVERVTHVSRRVASTDSCVPFTDCFQHTDGLHVCHTFCPTSSSEPIVDPPESSWPDWRKERAEQRACAGAPYDPNAFASWEHHRLRRMLGDTRRTDSLDCVAATASLINPYTGKALDPSSDLGIKVHGIHRDRLAACRACSNFLPQEENCMLLKTPSRQCNAHYQRLLLGGLPHPRRDTCDWSTDLE